MREARTLPEIVRDMGAVRERHATSIATIASGTADGTTMEALAETDAEIARFEDMCSRTTTHHLMSTGLRWDEELRHPAAAGDVARVRLRDRVTFRGSEVTILEATRMLKGGPGQGPAMADWIGPRGIRLGDALRLEHPAPIREIVQDAQSSLF